MWGEVQLAEAVPPSRAVTVGCDRSAHGAARRHCTRRESPDPFAALGIPALRGIFLPGDWRLVVSE